MRLLLIATLLGLALANRVSYEGHKVLRFRPSRHEFMQLRQFKNHEGFDFWNEPRVPNTHLDIMVSPQEQPRFFQFLKQNQINCTVLFDNVQRAIDAEDLNQKMKAHTTTSRAVSFDQYYRHAQINAYLQELASTYPNLVSLENIGQTYEGRDMIVIKISSGGSGNPAVLIDAGIHAREWIAPAMALYIIQQLVENNGANSELTNGLDWYILPVLNPDGYEYSHTTERMWRKTRSATGESRCPGVDGNRNFGFHWMEVGADSRPCSDVYAGPEAFSEIESRNIRDFAEANKQQIKLYLTFHSSGGHELAEQANAAHVQAGGEAYEIGSSTNALYPAAGGSDDYMKGEKGIELSYTVELTGNYSFIVPPEEIALLGLTLANRVSYEGHKVLRFRPTTHEFLQLSQFKNHDGFDFWNEPRAPGAYLDIMVSPGEQPRFFDFLQTNKIDFTVLFDNVQRAIDAEDLNQKMKAHTRTSRAVSFDQYYRHTEINDYLQELASSYPNLVSLENIGQTYEGRDMVVIKISSGGSGNPAVLIDAGIHAREWIAPAMALYIIQQLVENNGANSELTNGLDWYILPVLNPDGYEYSHTTDRMWRKTRSPTGQSSCPGVDGNRNFDYHWMGDQAFSEIEARNIRDFAEANKQQIKLYLTFHSYGGQELAEQANAAHVEAGGEEYDIGSSTNVLYAAAGGSDDYMKGVKGIELSYTVELTNTWYGFELPASLIEPTVTRFFEAVRVYGNYVKNNFKA
ncbi:hypothetical protein C0J52_20822 [Blattella germanica]|nr:hypothetical protein C0J52_20822 [Blattella germanica]